MSAPGAAAALSTAGALLDGVDAVVFDVDGTLVDHDHAEHQGLQRRLAELGRTLDEAEWSRWRELEEHHFARFLSGELSLQGQRRERVRDFTAERFDDTDADAWFAAYQVHFEASWRLFPDVLDVLDTLAASSQLQLGAFSNVSGDFTRHKLARVGIAERFEVVWGTDDVGAAKPDAEVFASLCARLGREPAQTLHVGDRYEADARGAVVAGLRGVWLDRPGADPRGRLARAAPDERVQVITTLAHLLPA